AAVTKLIETTQEPQTGFSLVEGGLHHEQQAQGLMLTDIFHAFAQKPTHPLYDPHLHWPPRTPAGSPDDGLLAGIHTIGHDGAGFSFDNERPAHQVLLAPVRVARSLITNGEWLDFMADGGYATPSLWLSDGWATVEAQGWNAPGY